MPTDTQLAAAVTSADAVAVTPWTDTSSSAALLARAPDPGSVVDRREIPELGVTVVRLSNGVEAWLKPTDFKNDQVLFALAASGGSSLAAPEKFVEAQLATGQVELSGAGGHRAIDLPEADRRQDRLGVAVHLALVAWHPGVEHACQRRDGAPTAQHQVHGAWR